jgi:hypothetical protein
METKLIAPCGMNCAVCMAHLRENNKCPGCRAINKNSESPCTRVNCKIKNCGILKEKEWKYCSVNCKEFPCDRLKKLDERYRKKYGMSMIENLKKIDEKGIRNFLKQEESKWIKEGRILCVHNRKYYPLP